MEYLKRKSTWVVMVFLVVSGFIADYQMSRMDENRLERAPKGEEYSVMLQVECEEGAYKEKMELELPSRKLTEEEQKVLLKEATNEIDNLIYAEGDSASHVSKNLNLITKCCEDQVKISWTSSDYRVVSYDGELYSAQISDEGQKVNLTASMRCGEFTQDYEITCYVVKPEYTEEELFVQQLYFELEKAKEKTGSDYVQLPETIDGMPVSWTRKNEGYGWKIALFEVVVVILLFYRNKEQIQQKKKLRDKELQRDYPEIVSKIRILLGAGMSVKRTVEIISASYIDKREKENCSMRPGYEEMVQLHHDLEKGLSEPVCYQNFAVRCGITKYYRLARILTEHLQKGNNGIMAQLEAAVEEAFEERAMNAKKLGEEANTKLLLPLLLMMGIVMAIVMVPAFIGIQI